MFQLNLVRCFRRVYLINKKKKRKKYTAFIWGRFFMGLINVLWKPSAHMPSPSIIIN